MFVNNDFVFECVAIKKGEFDGIEYPLDDKGRAFDPKSLKEV